MNPDSERLSESRARQVAATVMGWDGGGLRLRPLGRERGVFSMVWRVRDGDGGSVVVKMPRADANGEAARQSGAYDRERLAYAELLGPGIPAPVCHGIVGLTDGPAFVLEDLSSERQADQVTGLSGAEVDDVTDALVTCHQRVDSARAQAIGVRVAAPHSFPLERLERGVGFVEARFRPVFERVLADLPRSLSRFSAFSSPVCCHGDPRADNLVFTGRGVVLFDWQQMAIQIGEADLAWLLATSTTPEVRRAVEDGVIARYASQVGRSLDEALARYRAGLLVPGLAVLMLVQRQAAGRMADIARRSVERISAALVDNA